MTTALRSLDKADLPGDGKAMDLRTVKRHHTMHVQVSGTPRFYEVTLLASIDGELWIDAGSVGGAYPDDHTVFAVGHEGCARYLRARLAKLDAQDGVPCSVTASLGSC